MYLLSCVRLAHTFLSWFALSLFESVPCHRGAAMSSSLRACKDTGFYPACACLRWSTEGNGAETRRILIRRGFATDKAEQG